MAVNLKKESRAEDLRHVIKNFDAQLDLGSESAFYVNVDNARNSVNQRPERDKIMESFQDCAEDNRESSEYVYKRILFSGHRSCGKTTELKIIEEKLRKDYMIICGKKFFVQKKILKFVQSKRILRWSQVFQLKRALKLMLVFSKQ